MMEMITQHGHEKVVFCHDKESGLKAIIGIHSTVLGPAMGGCRMKKYASTEDALFDVLRLSRGMTYKCAAADLGTGGGKSVIIADPKTEKTEELLKAFARAVDSLGGLYISAEDMGMSVDDINLMKTVSPYIVGCSKEYGGLGDPSMPTAYGTYLGIRAGAQVVFGSDNLKGKTVAIQGAGNVGYCLAELLTKDEANLVIADVDSDRVNKTAEDFGARIVSPDEIYDVPCDIFAPSAIGGTINEQTIPRLKCKVIAGAANNQLLTEDDARRCEAKGIFYVPDFIINLGGVTLGAYEYKHLPYEVAYKQIDIAFDNVLKVAEIARKNSITTSQAANMFAEQKIEAAKKGWG
jgi:leucine dehydrogenase